MTVLSNRMTKRIALLMIVAAILAGFMSPFACDEIYNSLHSINNTAQEYHVLGAQSAHDCILTNTSSHSSSVANIEKKGTQVRADIFRIRLLSAAGEGRLGFAHLFGSNFFTLALLGISSLSGLHVLFIHLQDGHK